MATMLTDRMSSELHLHYAKRHVRLSKQTKGAEELARAMLSPIEALTGTQGMSTNSKEARASAYDNVVLQDGSLDDVVRNISDSAKQYDRSNPGRAIYTLLFPDGKTTSITGASILKEPDIAEQLLQRLKNLGEEHSLYVHVEPLTAAITTSRSAIAVYREAITNEKMVIAEEELAQAALRKQYEFNFLDAVKLFGKNYANRLFPKLGNNKKKVQDEEAPTE
ncbi:hypothetical protein L3073_09480 [Ancylomarina sp. DW003]|nr:hypothetical protein [Ancylomarina sp. DW003]MDE5422436.1 hypothetical protein [Ancylomarina sp. DW003]